MALVIAGDRSGVGKTTVTLALLASLSRKNQTVQSFKVGPDYIDPMFHQYVTGRACRNLDPVLTSETYVEECFARYTQTVEYALVEGVMGLFDGITRRQKAEEEQDCFTSAFEASTAHIARLLDLPILLVIDCSRLSGSVAAIAHGYRSIDPRITIAGVVLNRVGSDRHLELLKDALEPLNIPILGILRRQDNITIPDRHLGLIPTDELSQLNILIERLAEIGNTCFNWEKLLPLLKLEFKNQKSIAVGAGLVINSNLQPTTSIQNPPLLNLQPRNLIQNPPGQPPKVKIAIARDRAFNFYYQDNLDLLAQLGAELVFWSPLKDSGLPKGLQALYFGGGFPEVFAADLSENRATREAVKAAILAGMPTYAECGGLMYLCDRIVDFEGRSYSMVGVLPTTAIMGSRLTLGYRQAVALQDSPILSTGTTVIGHEFHRSHLSEMPTKPLFEIKGFSAYSSITEEGWKRHQVHASYIHLHWGANPQIAQNLIASAELFKSF